jgi:hypothetical protein
MKQSQDRSYGNPSTRIDLLKANLNPSLRTIQQSVLLLINSGPPTLVFAVIEEPHDFDEISGDRLFLRFSEIREFL